jgi:hypothetical protein
MSGSRPLRVPVCQGEAAWRGLAEANGWVLGADHADTILAREVLAAGLYDQRRLLESAAEYSEMAALRAATVGADRPDTERAQGCQADIQSRRAALCGRSASSLERLLCDE